MRAEWITIAELARREELSDATIRRLAGLQRGYRRQISFRRRGLGRRGTLEFNYPVVTQQIARALGREGARVGNDGDGPTLFTLAQKIDQLSAQVASLAARISEGNPT